MTYYLLRGVQLETEYSLRSYREFIGHKSEKLPIIRLQKATKPWTPLTVLFSLSERDMTIEQVAGGWIYRSDHNEAHKLWVDEDYRRIIAWMDEDAMESAVNLSMLKTILEIASLRRNLISLHSACVVTGEGAVCFTGPSGMGKSTRAESWTSAFGAKLLSGDRPQIQISEGERGVLACGVPWDGKERIYANRQVKLAAIGVIRRSRIVRVRYVTPLQARKWLLQQCFIPMWDTPFAFEAIRLAKRLSEEVPTYKILGGPGEEEASEVRKIIFERAEDILEPAVELRIRDGNSADEIVQEILRTGKISRYIISQLEQGVCEQDLVDNLQAVFEIDRHDSTLKVIETLDRLSVHGILEET